MHASAIVLAVIAAAVTAEPIVGTTNKQGCTYGYHGGCGNNPHIMCAMKAPTVPTWQCPPGVRMPIQENPLGIESLLGNDPSVKSKPASSSSVNAGQPTAVSTQATAQSTQQTATGQSTTGGDSQSPAQGAARRDAEPAETYFHPAWRRPQPPASNYLPSIMENNPVEQRDAEPLYTPPGSGLRSNYQTGGGRFHNRVIESIMARDAAPIPIYWPSNIEKPTMPAGSRFHILDGSPVVNRRDLDEHDDLVRRATGGSCTVTQPQCGCGKNVYACGRVCTPGGLRCTGGASIESFLNGGI